jgi:hypothetical protein
MLKVSQFRTRDRCVHRPEGILAEPCGKQHKVGCEALAEIAHFVKDVLN